jgi:hypothetical protein
VDGQQGRPAVVRTAQLELELELLESAAELIDTLADFRGHVGVILVERHLEQAPQLGGLLLGLDPGPDLVAQRRELAHDGLGPVGLGPEIGRSALLFELD